MGQPRPLGNMRILAKWRLTRAGRKFNLHADRAALLISDRPIVLETVANQELEKHSVFNVQAVLVPVAVIVSLKDQSIKSPTACGF